MESLAEFTALIGGVKRGEAAASDELGRLVFDRLVACARRKLGHVPLAGADEEDVALSVLANVLRHLKEGRLDYVGDSATLWKLLFTKVNRKVIDRRRQESRRAEGRTGSPDLDSSDPLGQLPGREPLPELEAVLADQLAMLDDPDQRVIAALLLEGHAREEIARTVGLSIPTIDRKLRRIRTIWKEDLE